MNGAFGEVDVVAEPGAKRRSATPTSPRCLSQPDGAVDVAAKRGATEESATPTARPPLCLIILAAHSLPPGCLLVYVAPPSSLMLLSSNAWDEAHARAQELQVEDNALVGEQAGSLPHPEQSQAAGARGGGPAVPARSVDVEAALDDLLKPRWSPRTLARWVPTWRGLTCCTPHVGTVSRNIVRGANVVTRDGSDRPSRGDHGIADVDGGDADGAAIAGRPMRVTTKRNTPLKEPSTWQAAVLLKTLLSLSTHINIFSRRSRSVERTIAMVMGIDGRPCLGSRTPIAMD